MGSELIGAIDQGTTGTRFILFDEEGRAVASAYREHVQHYPQPGWVEHDPAEIWRNTVAVMAEALAGVQAPPPPQSWGGLATGTPQPWKESEGANGTHTPIPPHSHTPTLRALGITNQRETVVAWDARTGRPLHRAIVWQDRRTAGRCRELVEAGHAGMLRERTGLPVDPYFSATKMEWLLREVPAVREAAREGRARFGTIDSWLAYRLTGAHVTDPTNASRTLLFDLRRLAWDPELLALFGVPAEALPEVVPSIAPGLGLRVREGLPGAGTPLLGILGDQQAALFGQAGFGPGDLKNTYGTGSFLLLNTGAEVVPSRHGLLSTVAYQAEGEPAQYALEGSVFVTGAAVQWLRDSLGIIAAAPETEALAESLPDNGGVTLVPAFVGLGAPYWEPEARGMLVGLTRGSGRAHLARAALEAMAYQTREVIEAMRGDAGLAPEALRVDGGAVGNNFLCRFQADILGMPVLRPTVQETTALGAAYAAGLAAGVWPDREALRAHWRLDRRFEPAMGSEEREVLWRGWQRAVRAARAWAGDA